MLTVFSAWNIFNRQMCRKNPKKIRWNLAIFFCCCFRPKCSFHGCECMKLVVVYQTMKLSTNKLTKIKGKNVHFSGKYVLITWSTCLSLYHIYYMPNAYAWFMNLLLPRLLFLFKYFVIFVCLPKNLQIKIPPKKNLFVHFIWFFAPQFLWAKQKCIERVLCSTRHHLPNRIILLPKFHFRVYLMIFLLSSFGWTLNIKPGMLKMLSQFHMQTTMKTNTSF